MKYPGERGRELFFGNGVFTAVLSQSLNRNMASVNSFYKERGTFSFKRECSRKKGICLHSAFLSVQGLNVTRGLGGSTTVQAA